MIISNCEICKSRDYLETHHIQSLANNGTNKKSNKVKICANCHNKVHFGDIIIEGWFLSTAGQVLIWREKTSPQITNSKPHVYLFN